MEERQRMLTLFFGLAHSNENYRPLTPFGVQILCDNGGLFILATKPKRQTILLEFCARKWTWTLNCDCEWMNVYVRFTPREVPNRLLRVRCWILYCLLFARPLFTPKPKFVEIGALSLTGSIRFAQCVPSLSAYATVSDIDRLYKVEIQFHFMVISAKNSKYTSKFNTHDSFCTLMIGTANKIFENGNQQHV